MKILELQLKSKKLIHSRFESVYRDEGNKQQANKKAKTKRAEQASKQANKEGKRTKQEKEQSRTTKTNYFRNRLAHNLFSAKRSCVLAILRVFFHPCF